MLIAVRHGKTSSNEDGKEKLRGWLPVPLTLEGMMESGEVAELIEEHAEDVKHVYCSTLVRAVQSAEEVGQALQIELEPDDDLRDFNTGDLAGSPVDKASIDKINSFIKRPNQKIPGGESYNQFLSRITPKLKKWVESDECIVVVAHGRVMTLLNALSKAKGEKPDVANLIQPPPIDPSGLMVIGPDWEVHYSTPKLPETKRMS